MTGDAHLGARVPDDGRGLAQTPRRQGAAVREKEDVGKRPMASEAQRVGLEKAS